MNNEEPTVQQSLETIKNALQQLSIKYNEHLILAKCLMVLDNRIKELEKQIEPVVKTVS